MRSLLLATVCATIPMVAAAQDWSGPYLGITSGTGTGDIVASSQEFDLEGEITGIFGGYNVQNGNLVYGAELSYQKSDIRLVDFPDESFDEIIDLKGRLGYAVGSVLVYGVVGISSNTYVQVGETESSTGDGPAFGLGVDYQVTDQFFVGAEYLTRRMENAENPGSYVRSESDVSTLSVRLGLRF